MRTILLYLLQVMISSGILYGYYHFFLRNKKFHQYNRYYLLMATVISICIPFLRIPVYFDAAETEPILSKTLTVLSYGNFEEDTVASTVSAGSGWFSWRNMLSSLYVIMAAFLFTRFCVALIRIVRLVNIYPGEKIDNIRFINTNEPATPFSFFRWLFWNNKIELNSDNGQQIFRHELFHIRQKHSWDIIFTEFITIVFWMNPFFHLFKKEIRAIHEFLADKFAVEENKVWDYAELLLMQVLGSPNTRLTNPFFHNQIKRRITMLTTSKKTGAQYLRKIMVLPFTVIIVGLFAFTYKNRVNDNIIPADEEITIVVDASHGGNDPGAKSPDNKYKESEISLEIAKRIQELAKEYHVKVIMTRENDEFPGGAQTKDEGLRKRVEIANNVKPAAFISIHLNTEYSNGGYTKSSGMEAYISNKGKNNGDKQLASVILQSLSSLYKTETEVKIRSTSGVYVLDQGAYPSVLLECGFINNSEDMAFITNKSNQEKIARKILESVVNFKSKSFEMSIGQSVLDTVPSKNSKKAMSGVVKRSDNIKPNNEVVVVGYSSSKNAEEKPSNNEVVVMGHPAKKNTENARAEKEIIVTGYPILEKEPLIVFEKVESEPSFPGGNDGWSKYLMRNSNPSVPIDNGAPAGLYKVEVLYIVKKDGSISDIKALTNHGYGMEAEAIRVIKNGPNWIPAMQQGKKVNAYRKQPITFLVEEETQSFPEIPPITLDQLKNSSPHSLLRLHDDVTFVSYLFSIDDQYGTIHQCTSKGPQFSIATSKLINEAEKGRLITIERIVGSINGKETKLPAVTYKVI